MTSKAKRRIFDVVRIAVCAAALWLVFQGVSLSDRVEMRDGTVVTGALVSEGDVFEIVGSSGETMRVPEDAIATDEHGRPAVSYGLRTAWAKSRKMYLLLAVLLHLPVVLPQALRFLWLLKVQGIALSYWECLKMTLAGNFLNFAAPLGSNAGDVFKAYFVSLHTHQKTEAVTTVILDRVIGLGTLVLIVAAITVLVPSDTRLAMLRPYVLGMVGIGSVVALLYFSSWVRGRLPLRRWAERLPLFGQIRRMDQATTTLLKNWRAMLGAAVLTAGLQLLAMMAYLSVAVALRLETPARHFFEFLAYFYSGVVVQALPGPPQGLGTVELTYRFFFEPYGSPSQIVCMALAIRLVVLIVALPGLFVTATGAYRPRQLTNLDELSDEPVVGPTRGAPVEPGASRT